MTVSASLTDTQRLLRAQLQDQVLEAQIASRYLKDWYFLLRAQNLQRAGLLERNASVLHQLREKRRQKGPVEQPELEKISVKSVREKELARSTRLEQYEKALTVKLLKQRRAELREELLTTCRQIKLALTVDKQSIQ